jgi:hypothetical protein
MFGAGVSDRCSEVALEIQSLPATGCSEVRTTRATIADEGGPARHANVDRGAATAGQVVAARWPQAHRLARRRGGRRPR